MKITFLGTGTSFGVPVIGCRCAVCRSTDPRNKRTRSSLHLSWDGSSLLIDASTDFRFQALAAGLDSLDGILITHPHADHIHGLDDIRIFSREKEIPVYGSQGTLEELRLRFSYIFEKTQEGGGKPRISLNPVVPGVPFRFRNRDFLPVGIKHGELDILGYRWDRTAYLTDCSAVPEASRSLLAGLDLLILGTLRHRPHPTHFSVSESLALIRDLQPRRVLFTHMCHDLEHQELDRELPEHVSPAYDGQILEMP